MDRPNVANRLDNLAPLFHAINCLAEAEPLMRGARDRRAELGADQPDVA